MNTAHQNINFLQKKIAAAAAAVPQKVQLIAVGKTFDAAAIRAVVAAGLHHIGENYIQESMNKIPQLSDLPIVWHFIGHVQSNKSKQAARLFDWVHTVDSAALARRLSAARAEMPPLNICLQINIDREASKRGVMPEEASALAQAICQLPNLHLRGLMTIPSRRHGDSHAPYRALALLKNQIAEKIPLDVLSMGMSDDFVAAIAEGATHIRLGRAIFGVRA